MPKLTHLDEKGKAQMVDVGRKPVTARRALAEGFITMPPDLINTLSKLAKGNAYEIARLGGIMGAKQTANLIPLCHSLPLDQVSVQFEPHPEQQRVRVVAEASCHARTGVEMEALVAVNVALLTLYDMGKATARDMVIGPVRLLEKTGGKSGHWQADPGNSAD